MLRICRSLMLVILLALSTSYHSQALQKPERNNIKIATFLSPKFVLGPGSVIKDFYYDIDFPKGHIAIRSFDAEVVDEAGNSVPLHETYVHHWLVKKYLQPKHKLPNHSDNIPVRNSGTCEKDLQGQYFGFGSETRGTSKDIPYPFGIEIGNPSEIPEGYEEKWMLDIHAIDTRGVEDKMGCAECRRDLYDAKIDEFGHQFRPEYKGGLLVCYNNTQCKLREGFQGPKRSLYLKYTVKWIDWNKFLVPLKIYILDVTDISTRFNGSIKHHCHVEYEVKSCSTVHKQGGDCVDVKKTKIPMKRGGYVIYGVAHQHSGGIGSTVFGQDERVICSSKARYGNGREAGNEAGYVVRMSTCHPEPGSVKINYGETLTMESYYNRSHGHTGVMDLFYLLVAERLPHHNHRRRKEII